MGSSLPLFVMGIFIVVLALFAAAAVYGLVMWSRNNAAPVLRVPAIVVSKNIDATNFGEGVAPNVYYVVFRPPNGVEQELRVSRREYGLWPVGTSGMLTYQGRRFKGFEVGPG